MKEIYTVTLQDVTGRDYTRFANDPNAADEAVAFLMGNHSVLPPPNRKHFPLADLEGGFTLIGHKVRELEGDDERTIHLEVVWATVRGNNLPVEQYHATCTYSEAL